MLIFCQSVEAAGELENIERIVGRCRQAEGSCLHVSDEISASSKIPPAGLERGPSLNKGARCSTSTTFNSLACMNGVKTRLIAFKGRFAGHNSVAHWPATKSWLRNARLSSSRPNCCCPPKRWAF